MTIVQFLIKLGPFIDVLTKLIQAGAIIIGGWWVWRNYFRGRTHVPRLQVELKAKELRAINGHYLLATLSSCYNDC